MSALGGLQTGPIQNVSPINPYYQHKLATAESQ